MYSSILEAYWGVGACLVSPSGLIYPVSSILLLEVGVTTSWLAVYLTWFCTMRIGPRTGCLVLICDYSWFYTAALGPDLISGLRYVYVDGWCSYGQCCGIYFVSLRDIPSFTDWQVGAYFL